MKAALVGLLAAAAIVAGVVLSGTPGSPAAAMTGSMSGSAMTQPPASAPTPAAPLQPTTGGTGRPLLEPAVYSSHHGVLDVTLVASRRRVTIAGRRVLADVYNGSFVAPTLIVSPGDLLQIKLVDHLHEPTNLHFHGLEVSPSGDADNIFVSVNPSHAFQYSFRLPRSAPTGTFWYHSHEMVPMSAVRRYPDTGSEEQVFDGLSGLVEVRA
jgi:suppressor of ftsI